MENAVALNVVNLTRRCTKCGIDKAYSEYTPDHHRIGSKVVMRQTQCRDCRREYQRAWRERNFAKETKVPEKFCGTCGEIKPASEFRKSGDTHYGLSSACKKCLIKKDRGRYYHRRPKQRLYAKNRYLRLKYGITAEVVEAILHGQCGNCAICKRQLGGKNGMHIDHCHATGKLRGLLCYRCNPGIGQFEDSPERLEATAAYIRRHRDAQ